MNDSLINTPPYPKEYVISRAKLALQDVDVIQNKAKEPNVFRLRGESDMQVNDGFHTMDELYEHRIQLWIAFCLARQMLRELANTARKIQGMGSEWPQAVWRSKKHHDGTSYKGWFLLGVNKEKGKQMTYHIPLERWEDTDFAETLDMAPEFDGHTPGDVLERLKSV